MKSPIVFLVAILIACLLGIGAIVLFTPSCSGPSPISGTYVIDTVRFRLANPSAAGGGLSGIGPATDGPGIHIDTNIKINGFYGGTVKSRAPYAVAFDSTDNSGAYERLEFTRIEVIYDDGTHDPAAVAMHTPLGTDAKTYEMVNSASGGRIVRSTVSLFSGRIPGVITRDESFRLVLEGRFIAKDGIATPFTIDQRWEVVFDQTTKPASEVLQDK